MSACICPHCGYDLEQDAPVAFGRLSYLPTFGVACDGRRIDMPPQCHEMLGALVRMAGRPISRTVVEDRMGWDTARSNMFEVRLCAIRKALAAYGLERVVKTVRGYGYMLDIAEMDHGAAPSLERAA